MKLAVLYWVSTALLPVAALSQSPGFVVPIVELSDDDIRTIDLHDGTLDDWVRLAGGAPTLSARDFVVVEWARHVAWDPASLNFGVWLGWHANTNRIYGAIERVDDIRLGQQSFRGGSPEESSDNVGRQQDFGLHVVIDGDARRFDLDWWSSGGLYQTVEEQEARRDQANRETQWFAILGDIVGPWRSVYLEQNSGLLYDQSWFVELPYAYGGGHRVGESPVITVEEFYVTPFDLFVWDDEGSSVVSDLRTGGRIYFRLGIWDRDSPYSTSSPFADVDYMFPGPRGYAEGVLVSRDALPAEVEAKEDSWAMIKLRLGAVDE